MAGYKAFTAEWCDAWAEKIRESEDYARYNKGWKGDMSGIISPDPERNVPEELYLYMHFDDGKVISIRMETKEKAESCVFVVRGDYVRWKQVGKKEIEEVTRKIMVKVAKLCEKKYPY